MLGWFGEYYSDSRSWAPPGFRSWTEELDSASSLRDWCPSIITGPLQTEDYARVLLSVHPDVTDEVVSTRLSGRMALQKRLFARDVPTLFLIDQLALYRLVGSLEIMAEQLRRSRDFAHRLRRVLGNERQRQRVDGRGNPLVARPRFRYASVRGMAC